jgi:hypothetical protein
MNTRAVITGDIINFTQLPAAKRQALVEDTERLLRSWTKRKADAQIFRGDSYQVLFEDITEALRRSLQLVCWFKKHSDEANKINLNTRVSIGIGEVAYQGKTVLNSDGEAFHLSGRKFDKMKAGEFLSINTNNPEKNATIEIILNFVNKYINDWTLAQAEVIFLILENKTQQEIAEELSLSQPSVNSRLKLAGWKELEPAINHMAYLAENNNTWK